MEDSDRTLDSNRTVGAPGDVPTLISPDQGPALSAGTVLAERYHIVELLGLGGMGAVYKVFDRKLTRIVALKTILPEMAATPTALKRFKQEVLLAQSIVHKNVVRIFDIGEDGATKFITMDFIEGVDLKTLIKERGKLPPTEAAGIIRQVCEGLETAHAAGVVHRDLKPQNIMLEKDGHIVVMDFGIAQSGQSQGVTQTGAFLGTPDYMSPEQAQTEDVDARSDIFSLGLIFFELLTGKLPFQGKTLLETMFIRTKERAITPAEIDQSVPKGANDIVIKCLQIKREDRYQNVTELLKDLEAFDPTQKIGAAERARSRFKKLGRYRNVAAVVAFLLVALDLAWIVRDRIAGPGVAQHAPETVLIADFSNHTGDPIFDGVLESVAKLGLEGAGFVTAYDRSQVRGLGAQAPAPGKLDEIAARQIAVNGGVGIVLSGSLDPQDGEFLVRMKAIRAVTGSIIANLDDVASNKDQVAFTAEKLIGGVRKAIGDETPDDAQRYALETYTNTSLEVLHEYVVASQALTDGKADEALRLFSKIVDLDQNFALAYRGMAFASINMHQAQDAEKYIKLALEHIDRMTERERYRTRASYYFVTNNSEKCVEEYDALISKYPADSIAHNNVSVCLSELRQLSKALDHVRQAVNIFPKRPGYRMNFAVYTLYGSDFRAGEDAARTVQELDPSYVKGYIAMAFAQLGQGRVADATETYQKLSNVSVPGASSSRMGLADLALYEGRFAEAARLLEEGADTDLSNKFPDQAATKFAVLAYTRLLQGQDAAAIAAAQKALDNSKIVKVRFLSGWVLAATGQSARAKALADDLATELLTEAQSYAKLIEGEIALKEGDPRAAVFRFKEGNDLLDTWISRFDLGRAYLEAGAFTEADSELERCITRRGEALALFLDESPTYGFFPLTYYYQGRVREGLKSPGFVDSYKTYLSIREKTGEDPLLTDIRKRPGL
jgi:eukaryotic-like serine/threonine-protein kinase